jgi:hypothetical protein
LVIRPANKSALATAITSPVDPSHSAPPPGLGRSAKKIKPITIMKAVTIPSQLPHSIGRRYPQIAWAFALSPFVLLLTIIAMAVHIRLGLGHWPTPIYENYQTPASLLHMRFLERTLDFSVYFAGPLWLLCLLVPQLRPSSRQVIKAQVMTAGLGWLLIIGFLTLDPTTFSAWLLD